MSTKLPKTGHGTEGAPFHESVTFEPRDINVLTVVKQLIYLAITIVLSLLVCMPILRALTHMASDADTPMAPVREEMNQADRARRALPPEPRLQGVPGHEKDPQQDLREKIAADNEANESSGWVDQAHGIAKIPVREAMKIIVEKNAQGKNAPEKKPEKKK
jgi:hypothetical protein